VTVKKACGRIGLVLLVVVAACAGGLAQEGVEPVVKLDLGSGALFNHAAFSPDGASLAVACLDGSVKLYSTQTWDLVWETAPLFDTAQVSGVDFSPDGTIIAASSPERLNVILLDAGTGAETGALVLSDKTPDDPQDRFIGVTFPVFSPDGTRLACTEGGHGCVKLVHVETGEELGMPIAHDVHGVGYVLAAFSPDGTRLASSDWDGGLVVVDLLTDEVLARKPTASAYELAFAPDGTLYTCAPNRVKRWDKTDWSMSYFGTTDARTNHGVTVAISPDGTLLASSLTHLRLWNIETETMLSSQDIQRMGYVWLQFSPDGTLLAGGLSYKAAVEVWSVADLVGDE